MIKRPIILKSEVKSALSKMKNNKAAGLNEIVVKMLTALHDLGINNVTKETRSK